MLVVRNVRIKKQKTRLPLHVPPRHGLPEECPLLAIDCLASTYTGNLLLAGGRWTLDWEGMEAAMKEHPEVKLYMLCNPYNPVGEQTVCSVARDVPDRQNWTPSIIDILLYTHK